MVGKSVEKEVEPVVGEGVEVVEGVEGEKVELVGGESDEGDEEEEDDVNSPDFDEVIVVEDAFHTVSEGEGAEDDDESYGDIVDSDEEGEGGEGGENGVLEGVVEEEEGDESEEEEEAEEEEEVSDNEQKKVTFTTATTTKADKAEKVEKEGNIDFSEDFFPSLSAVSSVPRRAWRPEHTNENIACKPFSLEDDVSTPESTNESGASVGGDMSISLQGGGGGGVRNWSQIAQVSVAAAVVTAHDNNHTTENRYLQSNYFWKMYFFLRA